MIAPSDMAVAATPLSSHRRQQQQQQQSQTTTAHVESVLQGYPGHGTYDQEHDLPLAISRAKERLQMHQQEQQRQLHQLQQDHYYQKSATAATTVNRYEDNAYYGGGMDGTHSNKKGTATATDPKSNNNNTTTSQQPSSKPKKEQPQPQRSVQQQYLERSRRRSARNNTGSSGGGMGEAKLLGAATVMSAQFTTVMTKMQELLQPALAPTATSSSKSDHKSSLVFTNTNTSVSYGESQSFASTADDTAGEAYYVEDQEEVYAEDVEEEKKDPDGSTAHRSSSRKGGRGGGGPTTTTTTSGRHHSGRSTPASAKSSSDAGASSILSSYSCSDIGSALYSEFGFDDDFDDDGYEDEDGERGPSYRERSRTTTSRRRGKNGRPQPRSTKDRNRQAQEEPIDSVSSWMMKDRNESISSATTDATSSAEAAAVASGARTTKKGSSNPTSSSKTAASTRAAKAILEMSPMMRMRYQAAQQATAEMSSKTPSPMLKQQQQQQQQQQSNHKNANSSNSRGFTKQSSSSTVSGSSVVDGELSLLQQSHSSYKTEEHVKAEKQRKWKRKMIIAQQQQQQEQAELGHDDGDENIIDDTDSCFNPSIATGDTGTTGTSNTTGFSGGGGGAGRRRKHRNNNADFDEDDEFDDDASAVSFGCRPGTNFVEIWAALSGMEPSTASEAAKKPAEFFQKMVSSRCGIELEEVSSSEAEDEDDDGRRNRRYSNSDMDDDDEESRDKRRQRAAKKVERGRSRQRRSSNRTDSPGGQSLSSQPTETSDDEDEQDPTSLDGEAPKKKEADSTEDAIEKRDQLENHLLAHKPHFRILGKHKQSKAADSVLSGASSKTPVTGSIMSTGSSKTPKTGTAGSVMSASQMSESMVVDDIIEHGPDATEVAPAEKADTGSARLGGSQYSDKQSALASVKSVSFDESTISKPSIAPTFPRVDELEKTDPDFIKKFVSGLSHHGLPLLWHHTPFVEGLGSPTGSGGSVLSVVSGTPPESVTAYVKLQSSKKTGNSNSTSGTDGFGDLSFPKKNPANIFPPNASQAWDCPTLVWYRETVTPQGLQREELASIDLFDVASIESSATSSPLFLQALDAYPYTMPSRTLVLQLNPSSKDAPFWGVKDTNATDDPDWLSFQSSTSQKVVVLEASTDEVARTLVLGLKWMVARLAFNLIVGNLAISCEMLQPADINQHAQQQKPIERSRAGPFGGSGDDDSMGPAARPRPPIIRRTRVMNDMTFQMVDKARQKAKLYEAKKLLQQRSNAAALAAIVPNKGQQPEGTVAGTSVSSSFSSLPPQVFQDTFSSPQSFPDTLSSPAITKDPLGFINA